MKIISLYIRNIQALKGEHKIDFTQNPLAEAGLFAITGPTGAGKSTLLDAICLALYNEVPRFGKITKSVVLEKGAILAKNTREAVAEVVYQTSKGTYRSTWSIRHNRNHSLEDYHMSVVQLETNDILDLKKSQVPDKNAELIGLNFNQFLRAVVLSQGQFAKFLQAKHTERSELLERMTGGQIYRDLSAHCYRHYQKIQEDYLRIQEQQQQLSLYSPEERTQLEQEMTNLTQNRNVKQKELQEITASLQQFLRYQELQASIQKEKNNLLKLENQKSDIQLKKCAIDLHEKIKPLLADIKWLSHITEDFKEQTKKYQQLQNQQQTYQNQQQQQETELLSLNPDHLTWQDWFLQKEEEIMGIQQQIDVAQSRWTDAQKQLQNFFANQPERAKVLNEKNANELQDLYQQYLNKNQSRPWFGMNEEELSAASETLIKEKTDNQELLQKAERKTEVQNKMLQLQQQNETLHEQFLQLKKQEENVAKSWQNDQTHFTELRSKLPYYEVINLRENLAPDSPCPVCGSLNHPNAHEPLPDTSTLKEMEAALEKGKEHLQQIRQQIATLAGKIDFLQNELTALNPVLNNFGETPDIATLQTQKTTLTEKLVLLDTFKKEQHNLHSLQQLIQLKTTENEHAESLKSLQIRMKSSYPVETPLSWIRENKSAWQERNIRIQALTSQLTSLEAEVTQRRSKWEEVSQQVAEKVKQAGFSQIEEVQSAALLPEQLEQFQSEMVTWEKNIQATQTRLEEKEKDLAQIHDVVATWHPEQLQTSQKILEQEIHVLGETLGRTQGLLEQDREKQNQFAQLQTTLQEKAAYRDRWGRLNEKIGSANGDKFSKMVQALHMERLLWLANHRLVQMTPRYRFVTRKNEASVSQSDDLFIEDLFMGGEIRAASTLSGGESFLTSLALALGLSDMAAGQIQLSCMFIDEGFGTLDGETLDLALDTLEKLQAESQKTIGIISHVQGLKDRISTQIQLKPMGNGASTLHITGPKERAH